MAKNDLQQTESVSAMFVNNVLNKVFRENDVYDKNAVPHIPGVVWGQSTKKSSLKGEMFVLWQDPPGLVENDLQTQDEYVDAVKAAVVPVAQNTMIKTSDVVNAVANAIQKLGNIRNFTTRWEHFHNKSDWNVVNTISGSAIFKDALDPGTSDDIWNHYHAQYNPDNPDWYNDYYITKSSQNGKMTMSTPSFYESGIMTWQQLEDFADGIYAEWDATRQRSNNVLEFKLLTCHEHCHDKCHSNGRGRR